MYLQVSRSVVRVKEQKHSRRLQVWLRAVSMLRLTHLLTLLVNRLGI